MSLKVGEKVEAVIVIHAGEEEERGWHADAHEILLGKRRFGILVIPHVGAPREFRPFYLFNGRKNVIYPSLPTNVQVHGVALRRREKPEE